MSARLLRIREWERLAWDSDFRSGKMASLCFVSQRQLQRFFDQHFHTTPSKWLRQLQCRMARKLITEGYSNKAVAYDLKFASNSHFCREFKKIFRATPQSFAPAYSANSQMSPIDNEVANRLRLGVETGGPFGLITVTVSETETQTTKVKTNRRTP